MTVIPLRHTLAFNIENRTEQLFSKINEENLRWYEELGFGYLNVTVPAMDVYNEDYWKKYRGYSTTDMALNLTLARVNHVQMFTGFSDEVVVDVGIGAGDFVLKMDCFGSDINPYAIDWLKREKRWFDFDVQSCDVMTMFDVIEHIHDPEVLLNKCKQWCFISTPIYEDVKHVLRSKHYRPDEHCWYFTSYGIRNFMAWYGFECIHEDQRESDLGREGIGSFAFRRVG